jgi:hypothetical protein
MSTTIKTTFRIRGDIDPESVTRQLSLSPTRTWRKGDLRGGSPVLRYETDGWALVIREGPSLHVSDEIRACLEVIGPCASRVRELLQTRHVSAQICLGVDVLDNQHPSISISASELAELAGLGVSIDIDIV